MSQWIWALTIKLAQLPSSGNVKLTACFPVPNWFPAVSLDESVQHDQTFSSQRSAQISNPREVTALV